MVIPTAEKRNRNNLSAAVMVYNMQDTLAKCLDSLSFCDEIVVIDDCSNDGTWELLQNRSDVRSFQHKHSTLSNQRQRVSDACTGDWVLTMDADEWIPDDLARSIRRHIQRAEGTDGFYLCLRRPYPSGLRGYTSTWHPRLIRKQKSVWIQNNHLHSPLDKEGIRFARIRDAHFAHAPMPDLKQQLQKSVSRSALDASQSAEDGKRASLQKILFSPVGRFLKSYFRESGWRFGLSGLIVAWVAAFEGFCKYALLPLPPKAMKTKAENNEH